MKSKYRISLRKASRQPFMEYVVEVRGYLAWIELKTFAWLEQARDWIDAEKARDAKEGVVEYR